MLKTTCLKLIKILPFPVFLFVTLNVGLNFEYSPIPLFFILAALFFNYYRKPYGEQTEVMLAILACASIVSVIAYVNANAIKEAVFFLSLLAGYVYCKKENSAEIRRTINTITTIYLIVAFAEMLLPGFSELKSHLLTRSYFSPESTRGVSSISTEPSFFALTLFSCWLIQASVDGFKEINIRFTIKILIGLVLTKSSMILLMMPAIIFFSESRRKLFIGFFAIIIPLLFYAVYSADMNFRALNLVIDLMSEEPLADMLDDSASARLFYITKDISHAMGLYFFPFLNGSYELFNYTPGSSLSLDTIYDPNLSGSLLGRFIVQFGFILLLYIIYVGSILQRKISFCGGAVMMATLIAVCFQMISLIFFPISFSLGVFAYFIHAKATSNHGTRNPVHKSTHKFPKRPNAVTNALSKT